ncbi:MAG: hypothetical protein ACO1PW_10010 [Actinomycetota bacterium]
MGQPITVVEKPSSNPSILRFETNRPLSGLDHERYTEPPSELLDRPVDELARRLFAKGGISAVHINSSMVTVTLAGGSRGEGLADVICGLFLHYPASPTEGVTPPSDEGDRAPEVTADPGATPAAETAEEPAAAAPAAPEAADRPDAATTEPGVAPVLEDAPAEQPKPEDDTSLAPPLDAGTDEEPAVAAAAEPGDAPDRQGVSEGAQPADGPSPADPDPA